MIDWFILLTPVFILPIILLFAFVGCLVTKPVEFEIQRHAILALAYPPEGTQSAETVFEWGEDGTGRTETQRFPPGDIPEPSEDGLIHIELDVPLNEGTWSAWCHFTPSANTDQQEQSCPGFFDPGEEGGVRVEFHVTNGLILEIHRCPNGG